MNYFSIKNKEEKKDKLKSITITLVVWIAILLFVRLYSIKVNFPKEEAEIVNTILINFGKKNNNNKEMQKEEGNSTLLQEEKKIPEKVLSPKQETFLKEKQKIITGKNEKISIIQSEENEKKKSNTLSNIETKKRTRQNTKTIGINKRKSLSNDSEGKATINNLLKGIKTKEGSEGGDAGKIGAIDDPFDRNYNGDSKIGVNRNLINYIPGTMGRGGKQPTHSCSSSGVIILSYTVDKAGNVISVKRSGGTSDPCIVSTSIKWIKRYVKAERANFSSTGTYHISF